MGPVLMVTDVMLFVPSICLERVSYILVSLRTFQTFQTSHITDKRSFSYGICTVKDITSSG